MAQGTRYLNVDIDRQFTINSEVKLDGSTNVTNVLNAIKEYDSTLLFNTKCMQQINSNYLRKPTFDWNVHRHGIFSYFVELKYYGMELHTKNFRPVRLMVAMVTMDTLFWAKTANMALLKYQNCTCLAHFCPLKAELHSQTA
jgi:hypothetical protein